MTILPSDESIRQPKKILIAVDLGPYAEVVVSYTLIATKDLVCEYTLLYCLEKEVSSIVAEEKIAQLLKKVTLQLGSKLDIKTLIIQDSPLAAIMQLNATEAFNMLAIGTSNQLNSWTMGSISSDILVHYTGTLLAIPPVQDLNFSNNISIFIEKKEKVDFESFNSLNAFVSHFNIFINFVLFVKNAQVLCEEKLLIEEYQDYFDANITFSFVVEQEQTYLNFLKYINDTHCESAVIAWDNNTAVYQSILQDEVMYCSPKLPILYTKRR